MELRHLRYFMAIAEEGSFLHAAQRLHVSQPPLSTQIRNLEAELQVRLFERSPKGVRLTAAGAAFYAEACAVMARVEHARVAARRAERGEEGSLEVGFVSIADYNVLPPALKRFRALFPGVQVQLHELTTDAQVREIAARRLDLGIALGPIDEPDLSFMPLLEERLMLVVPKNHAAGKPGRPVSLRAMSAENFVMVPRHLAPGLHDLTISFCRSVGFVPRITQYARQMQTVISLVSSDFGCALVPESLRHLRRTGVRYLALRETSPLVETGVIVRPRHGNPAIPTFIEAVQMAAADYGRSLSAREHVRRDPLRK